ERVDLLVHRRPGFGKSKSIHEPAPRFAPAKPKTETIPHRDFETPIPSQAHEPLVGSSARRVEKARGLERLRDVKKVAPSLRLVEVPFPIALAFLELLRIPEQCSAHALALRFIRRAGRSRARALNEPRSQPARLRPDR